MTFGFKGGDGGGGGGGTDETGFGRRNGDRVRAHVKSGTAQISVIGPEFTLTGDIVDKGVLKVLGDVQGNIVCRILSVEETGSVDGDIRADTITVSGSCDGHINARVLIINKTARVDGKVVVHESLSVQPPARFEGHCRRGTPRDERKKPVDPSIFERVREDLADAPNAPNAPNALKPPQNDDLA